MSVLTQSTVSGPVCTIWWFVASDTIVAFPVCISSNLFSSLNMNSASHLSFAFTILKPICKTELKLSLTVNTDLCTSPLSCRVGACPSQLKDLTRSLDQVLVSVQPWSPHVGIYGW